MSGGSILTLLLSVREYFVYGLLPSKEMEGELEEVCNCVCARARVHSHHIKSSVCLFDLDLVSQARWTWTIWGQEPNRVRLAALPTSHVTNLDCSVFTRPCAKTYL